MCVCVCVPRRCPGTTLPRHGANVPSSWVRSPVTRHREGKLCGFSLSVFVCVCVCVCASEGLERVVFGFVSVARLGRRPKPAASKT